MSARRPKALHYTNVDEANELIARDPMALLIGFVLDQQVTVQKAFKGPLDLLERIGTLDAATLAATDLEPAFRQKPALHRYPAAMAERVHSLAAHIRDEYGGDAGRVWSGARTTERLAANLAALPGIGEMKAATIAAVLAKRYGIKRAEPLVPDHPTLGDVDSAAALADYQGWKRAEKLARRQARAAQTP